MCSDYGNGTLAESAYQCVREHLEQRQYHWLITGVAGFIGSNLLETLLQLNQRVTGLDNFLTGYRHNLEQVQAVVGAQAWQRFRFIEADIRDYNSCAAACSGVDFVLHHAALGSVARSISEPMLSSEINVQGFVNILTAARDAHVRRLVYAASSASYGDHPVLPKVEHRVGAPLSPYALTKTINEMYADLYGRCYGTASIGLRYFNVFGPRQDPHGAYAAVIPLWIAAMIDNRPLTIFGDGESSRDFCYVGNAVQANLLAALSEQPDAVNQIYNIAFSARTSLNALYQQLRALLIERYPHLQAYQPRYGAFRPGDVHHSHADISKAAAKLGYAPTHDVARGLKQSIRWYIEHQAPVL